MKREVLNRLKHTNGVMYWMEREVLHRLKHDLSDVLNEEWREITQEKVTPNPDLVDGKSSFLGQGR